MGWESFESGRYLRIFEKFIFEFFRSVNGRFFFVPSIVVVRMLWGGLLSHVVKVAAKFVRDVWVESECWMGLLVWICYEAAVLRAWGDGISKEPFEGLA